MFAELGVSVPSEDMAVVDSALKEFVQKQAEIGPIGFVAEDETGELVGAVSISHETVQPSLHNPTGKQATLYGMWVRPASRRQGVARALVATAVEASRAAGAGAVSLMASDAGRDLYRSLGFVAVPAMRLSFRPLVEIHANDEDPRAEVVGRTS
jgi:predicted N-acetyltransferase YhbS